MKEIFKDAVWSVCIFFGILMAIGYMNAGYTGLKQALIDPWNWIILIVVIVAATLYRKRRREKENKEPNS